MAEFNDKIMAEFRANAGEVEMFKGIPILILHHTGAKSGKSYEMPLAYLQEGDRKMLFASNGGNPKHPSWYHNLVAHPNVEIELGGGERVKVKATVLQSAEGTRIYDMQAERVPLFGEYRDKAGREIPVFALESA